MLDVLRQQPRSIRALPFTSGALLDVALELVGASFGNVQAIDWTRGSLEIIRQRGFREEFLQHFKSVTPDDRSACGFALKTRKTVVISDLADDKSLSPQSRSVILGAGVRAVQSVPIVSTSGAFIGILSTHFSAAHQPPNAELNMMESLARAAADLIVSRRAQAKTVETASAETKDAIASSHELLERIDKMTVRRIGKSLL
jgi:GAF domain-containing protein